MSSETCHTVFSFLLCFVKNTATQIYFGSFDLLSCLKADMEEVPSDTAVRNYNSSKDKRNCYSPFTS